MMPRTPAALGSAGRAIGCVPDPTTVRVDAAEPHPVDQVDQVSEDGP